MSQQQARLADLEASARQWEERCSELREALGAHEAVSGTHCSRQGTDCLHFASNGRMLRTHGATL